MNFRILTAITTGVILGAMSGCAHRSIKPETAVPSPTAKNTSPLNLEMTHFALNSSELTETGKVALKRDALELSTDPAVKIQARGYCDDRGSVKYNLALGERRAIAVKDYLVSIGIAADGIETVSFGKADPLNPQNNEEAWSLNRRESFTILNSSNKVALR